jgi:tRNA (mo5U34)-methyltransferase
MTSEELVARNDIVWHQRFELSPGVFTPGVNDIQHLLRIAGVPEDLHGLRVLDIGTTNGGVAFEAERRGASQVVAVDIVDPTWFGIAAIVEQLGSRVEYVQASVYELSNLFTEPFDVVVFWGVLYHLRHPLLALDNVRAVAGGTVYLETAIADGALPDAADQPLCQFFRKDEWAGDGSNWFRPTSTTVLAWLRSSGFEPDSLEKWPEGTPERCVVRARRAEGDPEFLAWSYERPVRCAVFHELAERVGPPPAARTRR